MKYVKSLAIYIASVILIVIIFPISANAYSIALGGSVLLSFIFFPITYMALRKQLKLSFSNDEKFICFLIVLFAITLIRVFTKNNINFGDQASFLEDSFITYGGAIIVNAAVITQFNARKMAKVSK
jgi:hypothetical protein